MRYRLVRDLLPWPLQTAQIAWQQRVIPMAMVGFLSCS